jgi:hypothetical protein
MQSTQIINKIKQYKDMPKNVTSNNYKTLHRPQRSDEACCSKNQISFGSYCTEHPILMCDHIESRHQVGQEQH